MSYQIECGHCGFRITFAGRDVPRTVKCEVCGGVLTVAVALPVAVPVAAPAPAPPPPPAPKLPAPPPPPPSAPAPVPSASDEARSDAERARHLAEPWPTVRRALTTARTAADVGLALFGFFLFLVLVVTQLLPPADRRGYGGWEVLVSWALLVPAVVHVAAQGLCAYVPQTHGREWATASACMAGFSPFALIGLAPHPVGVFFVVAGVAAAVASFGLWLAFLARLGQSLGDDALQRSASSYALWFWFGAVQCATLLGGAYLAELSKLPALVWFMRAVAAAIGLGLLRGYSLLLRTALSAIDRRAPVTPRS